eukprot:4167956-Prorocentrum_lima.AAC.1
MSRKAPSATGKVVPSGRSSNSTGTSTLSPDDALQVWQGAAFPYEYGRQRRARTSAAKHTGQSRPSYHVGGIHVFFSRPKS